MVVTPPVPALALAPSQRQPDDIAAAASFRPHDPVWAYPCMSEQWLPGFVKAASNIALLVTYHLPGGGTGVDSLMPRRVMAREISDDEPIPHQIHDQTLPTRSLRTLPTRSLCEDDPPDDVTQ